MSGDGRFGLFAGRRELVGLGARRRQEEGAAGAGGVGAGAEPERRDHLPGRALRSAWSIVMLLTGRVVADLLVAAGSQTRVRELAWTPDGRQVLLLGWELAELGPGEGTPLAYYDPKLGYVMRQIRASPRPGREPPHGGPEERLRRRHRHAQAPRLARARRGQCARWRSPTPPTAPAIGAWSRPSRAGC
ncbi:MAG: hypothetical protein U1F43_19330 [Myxococcota bacterium]